MTYTIDGTGLNPARSLGAAIFADTDPSALGQLWAFIVFPLIGAVVGVVIWLLVDDSPPRGHAARHRLPARHPRQAADDLVD